MTGRTALDSELSSSAAASQLEEELKRQRRIHILRLTAMFALAIALVFVAPYLVHTAHANTILSSAAPPYNSTVQCWGTFRYDCVYGQPNINSCTENIGSSTTCGYTVQYPGQIVSALYANGQGGDTINLEISTDPIPCPQNGGFVAQCQPGQGLVYTSSPSIYVYANVAFNGTIAGSGTIASGTGYAVLALTWEIWGEKTWQYCDPHTGQCSTQIYWSYLTYVRDNCYMQNDRAGNPPLCSSPANPLKLSSNCNGNPMQGCQMDSGGWLTDWDSVQAPSGYPLYAISFKIELYANSVAGSGGTAVLNFWDNNGFVAIGGFGVFDSAKDAPPQPYFPANNGNASSPVPFIMNPVNDPTGIRNYGVQVATDSSFTNIVNYNYFIDPNTLEGTVTLSEGVYYYHAEDCNGGQTQILNALVSIPIWCSDWSSPYKITVDNTRPGQPTPTSPPNGIVTNSDPPILSWNAATDYGNPATGVLGYQPEMDTSSAFNPSDPNLIFDPYTVYRSTTVQPNFILGNSVWYWRVRAVDWAGNIGPWSATWSITIDITPPSTPALQSPGNGAASTSTSQTFTWSAATDDTSVSSYNIQIDTSTTFDSANRITASPSGTSYTANLKPGVWYWEVQAVDAAGNKGFWSSYFTLNIADFSISAAPNPLNVVAGNTGTWTITVMSLNQFTGTVSLTDSPPNGLTCSAISPISVSPTSSTPATATLSCSGPAGSYTVPVTGTSTPLTHTANPVFNSVLAPDFAITANPSTVTVVQGTSATSTITITPANSFSGTVTLSYTSSPSGLTCNFNPGTITASGTSTITCNGSAGTYSVTVTGTSGSLTHNIPVGVTIQTFTIIASPTSTAALAGSPVSSIITIGSSYGFSGTVTLTLTIAPLTGLACSVNPASITGSGIATLTCNGSAGTYTVTVTGTSQTATGNAPVTVAMQDFTMSASPSSVTVLAGTTSSSTITITPLTGFTGPVTLSSTTSSAGLTCTLNPTSITSSGTSSLSCNGGAGRYSVNVTATSSNLTHRAALSITVQDFDISSTQTSLTLSQGQASATINVGPLAGFNGNVTLTQSIGGVSCGTSCPAVSFATNPVSLSSGPAMSTMNVQTTRNTPAGNYTVTVTGTSSSVFHSITISLRVPPDFSIASTVPSPLYVNPGSSTSSTNNLASYAGFSGAVSLTVTINCSANCPTISLNTYTVSLASAGTGQSTLSIATFFTTAPAFYTITVNATSGSISHITMVSFTVNFVYGNDFRGTLGPGWAPCPNSRISSTISGSNLVMTAGQLGGGMCFYGIPSNVLGWTVVARGEWNSGSPVIAMAAGIWNGNLTLAYDGVSQRYEVFFSYSFFPFYLSYTLCSANAPPLAANVWHDLGIAEHLGIVSFTVDGQLVCALNGWSGPLTWVELKPGLSSTDNFDYITITQTDPSLPFSLAAFPTSLTTIAGTPTSALEYISEASVTFPTITLTASVSGGTGLTCTLSPSSVPDTGGMPTSTLTCIGSAGVYTVTVTGTSGATVQSVNVVVTVQDFTVSASPNPAQVVAGSGGSSTISLTSIDGFAGAVSLTSSVSPSTGLTCSVSPSSVTVNPTGTATLTCNQGSLGNYQVNVTATSGSISHSITVTVNVTDFTITASPISSTFPTGSTGTSTITIGALNGFTNYVYFSTTITPTSGLTCSISPYYVYSSGTTTLSCSSFTFGVYTVTVTGTSASTSHNAPNISFTVKGFILTVTPQSISLLEGRTGSVTITGTSVNGFSGTVSLSAGPTCATMTYSKPSLQISPGVNDSSVLSVTPSSSCSANTWIESLGGNDQASTASYGTYLRLTTEDFSLSAPITNIGIGGSTTLHFNVTYNGNNNYPGTILTQTYSWGSNNCCLSTSIPSTFPFVQPDTVSTSNRLTWTNQVYQPFSFPWDRNAFYAQGRYWIFFTNSTSCSGQVINCLLYATSTDGATWSIYNTGLVTTSTPSVITDGTRVYYVRYNGDGSLGGKGLMFGIGALHSDGSISFQPETVVKPATSGWFYYHLSLGLSSTGTMFVAYQNTTSAFWNGYPNVIHSNGLDYTTWQQDTLLINSVDTWGFSLVPLPAGQMYILYWPSFGPLRGRLYSNGAWGSQETVTSPKTSLRTTAFGFSIGNSTVYAIWQESGSQNVQFAIRNGSWSAPQTIFTADVGINPAWTAGYDPLHGKWYVFYYSYNTNQIWEYSGTPGNWSPRTVLFNTIGASSTSFIGSFYNSAQTSGSTWTLGFYWTQYDSASHLEIMFADTTIYAAGSMSSTFPIISTGSGSGTTTLTLTASDGYITRTLTLQITINGYYVSLYSNPAGVYVGGSGGTYVQVYPEYGIPLTNSTIVATNIPSCITLGTPSPRYFNVGPVTSLPFVWVPFTASSSCPVGQFPANVNITGVSNHSYDKLVTFTIWIQTPPPPCSCGGGSIAHGSLITLADGGRIPVQNLRVGDQMLGYNPVTGTYTISIVQSITVVDTTNMLIIHTASGTPFRVDANPRQTLWVKTSSGTIGWLPVTQIKVGDYLLTPSGWTPVTGMEFAPAGTHVMYDIVASIPYFADGYLDPIVKV